MVICSDHVSLAPGGPPKDQMLLTRIANVNALSSSLIKATEKPEPDLLTSSAKFVAEGS